MSSSQHGHMLRSAIQKLTQTTCGACLHACQHVHLFLQRLRVRVLVRRELANWSLRDPRSCSAARALATILAQILSSTRKRKTARKAAPTSLLIVLSLSAPIPRIRGIIQGFTLQRKTPRPPHLLRAPPPATDISFCPPFLLPPACPTPCGLHRSAPCQPPAPPRRPLAPSRLLRINNISHLRPPTSRVHHQMLS